MLKNQFLKQSALFDDTISHIDTSSDCSNIIHKRAVTSIIPNDTKKISNFSNNYNYKQYVTFSEKPQQLLKEARMSLSNGYEFVTTYRGKTIKHKVLSDLGEKTLFTYLENNEVLVMSECIELSKYKEAIDNHLLNRSNLTAC
jgi:hypothetical protein